MWSRLHAETSIRSPVRHRTRGLDRGAILESRASTCRYLQLQENSRAHDSQRECHHSSWHVFLALEQRFLVGKECENSGKNGIDGSRYRVVSCVEECDAAYLDAEPRRGPRTSPTIASELDHRNDDDDQLDDPRAEDRAVQRVVLRPVASTACIPHSKVKDQGDRT